ncbi:uncharacterized protein LOC113466975 [Diaphorina citri]|uniref:Uncharacterized protein LOC113466975 n=1 Tax=Diaphorina citri TaxID=121845 RepID=A0A3Q0IVH2_DIACI|nr:uncharacterized protein LOC113466975 [Diaphorina citri]
MCKFEISEPAHRSQTYCTKKKLIVLILIVIFIVFIFYGFYFGTNTAYMTATMNASTANDVKKHPGLSDTSEVSNNTPTLYIWDNTTAINVRNNTPVYILNNTTMNNLDNATTDDTNSDPWNHTSAENTEEYDYIEPSEVANERTEENITQYECGRRIVENPNFTEGMMSRTRSQQANGSSMVS